MPGPVTPAVLPAVTFRLRWYSKLFALLIPSYIKNTLSQGPSSERDRSPVVPLSVFDGPELGLRVRLSQMGAVDLSLQV